MYPNNIYRNIHIINNKYIFDFDQYLYIAGTILLVCACIFICMLLLVENRAFLNVKISLVPLPFSPLSSPLLSFPSFSSIIIDYKKISPWYRMFATPLWLLGSCTIISAYPFINHYFYSFFIIQYYFMLLMLLLLSLMSNKEDMEYVQG